MERYFVRPETVDRIRRSWIADAIEQYVKWLDEQHYDERCVLRRVPILVRFGDFARGRGARKVAALPRHVDAFVQAWTSTRADRVTEARLAKASQEIRGPIEQMLRVVVPGSVGSRSGRQLLDPFTKEAPGFFRYLREERGLTETTVAHHAHYLRAFEQYLARIKIRRLRDLTPVVLSAFVVDRASLLGKCGMRDQCGSIRIFLRYLYRERRIRRDLSDAVEQPRSYRHSSIPRSVTWDEVRRVLAAVDRRSTTGRRDYAILLLLVTYGLRAREVAALTLDDVDWKRERLRVPERKAGHSTAYPLSTIVGNALIEYLQRGRPKTVDRRIFFRVLAPHLPITHSAVSCRATHYLRKAGVLVSRAGSHTLRHTCAQRLVDADFSLKEIGDYLGHRSADSTRVYTKVAVETLRKVALGDGEAIV